MVDRMPEEKPSAHGEVMTPVTPLPFHVSEQSALLARSSFPLTPPPDFPELIRPLQEERRLSTSIPLPLEPRGEVDQLATLKVPRANASPQEPIQEVDQLATLKVARVPPSPQKPAQRIDQLDTVKQVLPSSLPQRVKTPRRLLRPATGMFFFPDEGPTARLVTQKPRRKAFLSREVLLILAIIGIAAFAHGFNMFHFPYFEDDEGTYLSQAWAVAHTGQLAFYTYWYDHAPFGWIQMGGWLLLSGGLHTFGPALYSGRVLMCLLQVGSTFLLYRLARTLSGSVLVAMIVSLLFALSPYGLYFHRRVLLDNIATFWMLLSIVLLVTGRPALKRVWLSALSLGISILSKEVTIFLIPVLGYLVLLRADRSHRWFATIGWITLVGTIISLYVLMATLKGELFPVGTFLGGTHPHVSLLGTLQFQASRGKDGGLFDLHSRFWHLMTVWTQDDPFLVAGGSICAVLGMLAIRTQRLMAVMGLATLSLFAFLSRGGEVIGFYLIPLLPLLALNIGLLLGFVSQKLKALVKGLPGVALARVLQVATIGLCFLSLFLAYTSSDLGFKNNSLLLWNSSQADAQNQATQWIEAHLPEKSRMIIDESMWTDLYDHGYTTAHYYWKVQEDPAIRDKIFHNDWHMVEYIVTTIQMLTDAQQNKMTLVESAIEHSTVIAHFETGGWPVEVRELKQKTPG